MNRSRVLAAILVTILLAVFGGAHWVVTQVAEPTFTNCRPAGSELVVYGFDSTTPTVGRLCRDGRNVPATATLDLETNTLTVRSSDPVLQALDGVRSAKVRVSAYGVDHSRDAMRYRVLEAITPFAEMSRTEPAAQEDYEPSTFEVGRPRITRSGAEFVLTTDLGAAARDDTVTLLVTNPG